MQQNVINRPGIYVVKIKDSNFLQKVVVVVR
jgi:hypothetical protein